jgi:hypothetical protein
MTSHRSESASAPARKVAYLVGVVVNVILLVLVNVRPGWRELSFLTERMTDVLPLVNLSLLASAAVNAVYLWFDPAWFKSIGQISVSAIGLAAALRTLRVFPFDFSAYAFSWTTVTRVLLVVAVFGSAVAIVAELARLVARASNASAGGHSARPRGAV